MHGESILNIRFGSLSVALSNIILAYMASTLTRTRVLPSWIALTLCQNSLKSTRGERNLRKLNLYVKLPHVLQINFLFHKLILLII